MLDSNVHFAGLTAPSMLDDMRAQLDQAKAAGQKPVNWLVRMEIMATLCEQARAAGELTGEAAHIFGIMVRGSWRTLEIGETPILMCEGDEYHQAILDMYAGR
jgi:hypothetical protein